MSGGGSAGKALDFGLVRTARQSVAAEGVMSGPHVGGELHEMVSWELPRNPGQLPRSQSKLRLVPPLHGSLACRAHIACTAWLTCRILSYSSSKALAKWCALSLSRIRWPAASGGSGPRLADRIRSSHHPKVTSCHSVAPALPSRLGITAFAPSGDGIKATTSTHDQLEADDRAFRIEWLARLLYTTNTEAGHTDELSS